jgi:hypothetical protein
MSPLVLTTLLFLGTPDGPSPAAMVLSTEGAVDLRPADGATKRRATAMDLLYPDDRLVVPPDGGATLVLLSDGARERLKPGARATVAASGCTPPGVADRLAPLNAGAAEALKGLRPLAPSQRAAVATARGPRQPAMLPTQGTHILSVRPTFRWDPVPGAVAYRVSLFGDAARPEWIARAEEPRLPYPSQEKPLIPGRSYRWGVTGLTASNAEIPDPVISGRFTVAPPEVAAWLTDLTPPETCRDAGELLVAALAYESEGLADDALAFFERLSQVAPEEPTFHAARAAYYQRAGRSSDAEAARKKVAELESPPGKG